MTKESKNKEITLTQAECDSCKYIWKPKLKMPNTPKACPRCKKQANRGDIIVTLSNGKIIKSTY